jgi:hypothetical protein
MPLYEMTSDTFRPLDEASFASLKVRERDDLQRLLRSQIEVLGDDLYVLTEEFGDWEDSRRRIDLLAIDRQANIVVIELKRTHDGGYMDLQALRYASMVSAMTFDRAEQIHGEFLAGWAYRRKRHGYASLLFSGGMNPRKRTSPLMYAFFLFPKTLARNSLPRCYGSATAISTSGAFAFVPTRTVRNA